MFLNSLVPLPPYKPTAKELARLKALTRISSLLGKIFSVSTFLFLALAMAHGVTPGTLGFGLIDSAVNAAAQHIPQAYGYLVDQLVPTWIQVPALRSFAMTALLAVASQCLADAKARNIKDPIWRRVICS